MNQNLEKLVPVSKAAKLRLLLPLIEEKIAAGVKYPAIVKALQADGLEFTESTFKYYLHRERKKKQGSNKGNLAAVVTPTTNTVEPARAEPQKKPIPKKEITFPDMTPEMMEYYEEMGKNGINNQSTNVKD